MFVMTSSYGSKRKASRGLRLPRSSGRREACWREDLNGHMAQLVHGLDAPAHLIRRHLASIADDRGVRPRADAPDMQVRDANAARPFDLLPPFGLQVVVGTVQQHSAGVAQQVPRPECDDARADD